MISNSPAFISLSELQLENETLAPNNASTPQASLLKCMEYESHENFYNKLPLTPPEPNIALISILLLIGTCTLALILKKLRRSPFFGSYVREM
jgi:hypothetical protein